MKSKLFKVLAIVLTLALMASPLSALKVNAEGNENASIEEAETYADSSVIKISSVKDLEKIRTNLKGNFVLTKDIDMSSVSNWQPIGTTAKPFKGTFNGNGHTIKNLKISRPNETEVGFFGETRKATVKNVKISGKVKGGTHVGILIGYCEDTKLYNCKSSGSVKGDHKVGGLVGNLCGANVKDEKVYNLQNDATVTGNVRCAGGIAGDIWKNCTLYNCVNNGNVTGVNFVGGIVGGCTGGNITNVAVTGKVKGTYYVGAIAGDNASYAGYRINTYFHKRAGYNNYNTIGSNAFTFNFGGTLNAKLNYQGKKYSNVAKAFNAWSNRNSSSKKKYATISFSKNYIKMNFSYN